MSSPVIVKAAEPNERFRALRLAFRHLDPDLRVARVALGLEMIDRGELAPGGVLSAWLNDDLVGAMVAAPVPGAAAAVWPPQVVDRARNEDEIADALVRHATTWLRERGAKLAQVLLSPDDSVLAAPLIRNGFRRTTALWYLRHDLEFPFDLLRTPERLQYATFGQLGPDPFAALMARTYEDTQDCPEIGDARTPQDAIAGHQSGEFDAERWWLAEFSGQAVGLLLVNDSTDGEGWEIAYIGVAPEFRRRGFGRELVIKALIEAKAAGQSLVTLAVDARNQPARELYRSLGFAPHEMRDVLLAVWANEPTPIRPANPKAG